MAKCGSQNAMWQTRPIPEHHRQPATLGSQFSNSAGVRGKHLTRGKMPLFLGHREISQRPIKSLFHRVLKRGGVGSGKRIAIGIAPFIHIETPDMVARHTPLFQKEHRPAIHAHGAHGQNQCQLLTRIAALFDGQRDFMAHERVKIGHRVTSNWREIGMPPGLPLTNGAGVVIDAAIDLRQIPARRKKMFQKRSGQRSQQIHGH